MGTMIYHENFKQLMIANPTAAKMSSSSGYYYPAMEAASGESFISVDGTNITAGPIHRNQEADNVHQTTYAGMLMGYAARLKWNHNGVVYSPAGTATTQKEITIGTAPASWAGLNNTPNRISPELYTVSNQAAESNSGIHTITITNNSASTISFDYVAGFMPINVVDSLMSATARTSLLMWIYQFDEAVELPAGSGITLGFSPWAS